MAALGVRGRPSAGEGQEEGGVRELTRRTILRGMAVAPIGGRIAAEHVKMRLMTGGLLGAGIACPEPVEEADKARKFLSFISWFKQGGENDLRKRAEYIDGFDADIIEMQSMSLTTKVRVQRQRNYERIVLEKQSYFKRTLARHGFVEAWL